MNKRLSNILAWGVIAGFVLAFAGFILFVISLEPSCIRFNWAQPTVVYKNIEPLGELSDIALGSNRLYVLYNRKQVVKAYSFDGSFLYAIVFPRNSGTSSLYVSDENLYYLPDSSRVFHYQNDIFQSIQPLSAYSETFQEHIHHIRNIYDSSEYASSQLYRIDGLDVVYSAADGTTHTVIDRPAWLYLFYPNILLSCMFAGFGLIAIAGGILKNREVHTLSKKYSSSKKAKEKQSDSLY